MSDLSLCEMERCSLCEVLDRVLNKGVVACGEVTISVADIDLLYLGLQLVLTSIETALQTRESRGGILAHPMCRIEMRPTNESARSDECRV